MDMRRTLVPVEVKEVKTLGERVLEFIASTENVDRMGDIIRSKGWLLKPFKKNPVFMWAHNYDQPPIGRALKVWVDKDTKQLIQQIEFADAETYAFADTIYKLYKGGFLHAISVGFIPLDWEGKDEDNPDPKWEGNVFTKQELLESSAVPVPANANALVNAREQGLITVKEFEAVTKEQKAKYTCECIDCGHTLETDEHCKDLECPKCGGTMRRIERPGPGEESLDKPEEVAEVEPEEPKPKEISQEQLRDDIDYVHKAIMKAGLNEDTMTQALDMAAEIIQRCTGNDMPDDILTKVGAVLNAKNKGRLTQIQELAQAVLDSAATDEGDKQLDLSEHTPTEAELTKQRALYVAEVTHLAIAQLKGKRIY